MGDFVSLSDSFGFAEFWGAVPGVDRVDHVTTLGWSIVSTEFANVPCSRVRLLLANLRDACFGIDPASPWYGVALGSADCSGRI